MAVMVEVVILVKNLGQSKIHGIKNGEEAIHPRRIEKCRMKKIMGDDYRIKVKD